MNNRVIPKPVSPCLGCDRRYIGCHSGCAEYKMFRRTLDLFNKHRIGMESASKDVYFSRRDRTIKYTQRAMSLRTAGKRS